MSQSIRKAMLLAAGLGIRLRPLTLTTPKPLLPLDGICLIDHQLSYLAQSGIREVVVNLHHLGDKIKAHVGGGSQYGLTVTYSEEPEILGTGGGIKKAGHLFGTNPFIALNADALIDVDIGSLIARHFSSKASATMVVKTFGAVDNYNPVDIDMAGFIKGFGKGNHFYTGLQILGPEILTALPPSGTVSCLIRDGYEPLLKRDAPIAAFLYEGYFNDLGTPERYTQAKRDIENGRLKLAQ